MRRLRAIALCALRVVGAAAWAPALELKKLHNASFAAAAPWERVKRELLRSLGPQADDGVARARAAFGAPRELIVILDQIFARYDQCAERLGLEKIKTIGDAYMIAAGAPEPYPDHQDAIAELALALVRVTQDLASELELPLAVRIGIHTGIAWGGVIGQTRIAFDVWGDTVNMAARMERHGVPGRIQLSDETASRLSQRFLIEVRGVISVKSKGDVRTHFLNGMKTPAGPGD